MLEGSTLSRRKKSTFSASLNGEEVLFGNNFFDTKDSYDHRWLSPSMSKPDEALLDDHNTRREAFHKKYNTEYGPLHWSRMHQTGSISKKL